MEIWFALLIPVIFTIASLFLFKEKITWWEAFIPTLTTLLLIIIISNIGVSSVTKDYEYWGNYVTQVRYYEPWDEYIHQTCTRSVPCGTDSDGNTQYCDETYDCSYVQYHSESFSVVLNDNREISVDENYYNDVKRKFNTTSIFVEMNRNYHFNDGDMYKNLYPNTYETYVFFPTKHRYVNKIQASNSIFNYPKVTEEDILKYKLFDYPEIENNQLNSILYNKPLKVDKAQQDKFNYINGMLGMNKQIKVWICLFNNTDSYAGYMQEAYWKHGNKNEFVICVGVDEKMKISWVHIFSWSQNKNIEIETRNFILYQKQLDLISLGDWLYSDGLKDWKRTEFKQFDYLHVEPPRWSKILIWITSLLSTLGILVWVTINEYERTFNDNWKYKSYDLKNMIKKLLNRNNDTM